jgi:hypothetical protein
MFAHQRRGSGIHIQLPDLLLKRHSAHQVVNAHLDRHACLFVERWAIGESVALLRTDGRKTAGEG